MTQTPSENTLELNVTHEMLTDLEGAFGRTTAKSPTRVAENDLGFDVQLSFALRVQFQYKRPQTTTSRGVSFSINGDQVSTLRMRDPLRVAYLVCPIALREDEVPGSITRTAFVDVHAVNAFTSRVYIPSGPPIGYADGGLKIKNGGYYPIPKENIYSWDDIRTGILDRNLGMAIRHQAAVSGAYQEFQRRLAKLANLYNPRPQVGPGSQYLTDGGEDPSDQVLNEEYATDLVNFARGQRQELIVNRDQDRDWDDSEREYDERGLWSTIENMGGARHPSTFRISRSTEYVFEDGDTASHLNLS